VGLGGGQTHTYHNNYNVKVVSSLVQCPDQITSVTTATSNPKIIQFLSVTKMQCMATEKEEVPSP